MLLHVVGHPLKILFVQAQETFGADAFVHAQIMRHLNREEFVVHVACPRPEGSASSPAFEALSRIPDIRLHPVRFAPTLARRTPKDFLAALARGLVFPQDFLAIRRVIATEGVAIVHGSDRPRSALYSVALARGTRAKAVVHMHVKWSTDYGRASTLAVNQADAIFGISRFVSDSVVASGKPRERVHTLPNAIDVEKWDPRTDGSVVRAEFSIAPSAPVLVSVSRLFPWKGQRDLLRALAIVVRRFPDTKLLIVGADEPFAHHGSFTQELVALARDLGLLEHVIFTGQRSDIPALMAAADIFTLPSFEEPFGLVYLEAMAMERPIIALDNGGTPEVVEHGVTGLLSPAGDFAALAANITRLLADPGARRAMGSAGRARVLAMFSAQRLASDAQRAYRSLALA
jgi:glycosyltransferase involved in cell wall biosynthesis